MASSFVAKQLYGSNHLTSSFPRTATTASRSFSTNSRDSDWYNKKVTEERKEEKKKKAEMDLMDTMNRINMLNSLQDIVEEKDASQVKQKGREIDEKYMRSDPNPTPDPSLIIGDKLDFEHATGVNDANSSVFDGFWQGDEPDFEHSTGVNDANSSVFNGFWQGGKDYFEQAMGVNDVNSDVFDDFW